MILPILPTVRRPSDRGQYRRLGLQVEVDSRKAVEDDVLRVKEGDLKSGEKTSRSSN